MTEPDTISADYSLRPSELASTLALLVEARQPVVVWGAPGCAKIQIAQQVAAQAGREYVDVRALLLDPVDLRGIPWRDSADRTRWAPPAFAPSPYAGADAPRWRPGIPHCNFIIRIPKTATTDRRSLNAASFLCEFTCTLVRLRTDHCLLPTPWAWQPRQPSFPATRPYPETSADSAPYWQYHWHLSHHALSHRNTLGLLVDQSLA